MGRTVVSKTENKGSSPFSFENNKIAFQSQALKNYVQTIYFFS